jgi:triacylglycerol lipase
VSLRLRLVAACAAACVLSAQAAAPSSAQAERPVLAVAGTFAPASSLDVLAGRLRADGYVVATMALPGNGRGDIAESAKGVADAVQRLRARTGAQEVDLIGHSQAGIENRYYLKFLGGSESVHTYVSLGSPQYGITRLPFPPGYAASLCALAPLPCEQLRRGSSFLNQLNEGDDTPPGAVYYSIWSTNDEFATPPETAKLRDGAHNVQVQHYCPGLEAGHVALVFDRAVYGLVRSALQGGPIHTRC